MRYVRWVVLLGAVGAAYACTPFVGKHSDGGGAGSDGKGDAYDGGPGGTVVPPMGTAGGPGADAPSGVPSLSNPNGAMCSADQDCQSGNCVDGACCTTSSCAACQACNLNAKGSCSPKTRGMTDPACIASSETCSAGSCDGLGRCSPAPAGTTCGASICENGSPSAGQWTTTVSFRKQCDGTDATAASCKDTAHSSCDGNLACAADGATCRTTCSRDVDCLSGFYCTQQGTCSPLIANGSPTACTANRQCLARFCSAGRCVECTIDYDCRSDRPVCSSGKCVGCAPGVLNYCPQNTNSCDSSNNCICSEPGLCFGDACAADFQCYRGDAPFCQHGKCGCAGSPCPAPYTCVATGSNAASPHCVLPVGLPCLSDTDCAPNKCVNGLCTYSTACSQDSDCTATCTSSPCDSAVCAKGACVSVCGDDSDYQCSSHSCIAHVCSTPNDVGCLRSADCRAPAQYCCSGQGRPAPVCLRSCD